jgi:outer membrane protein assembly factor BamD
MAIEILRSVVSNSPYGEYAAVAQYRIGLIQKGQGFFDDAKREFQKVVENYPESEWAKAAQFQMAACSSEGSPGPAYDQQTTQEAIAGFEEFVQAHPEAKLSEEAEERLRELKEKEAQSHYKIGIFYEKKKKSPEAAKVYYEYVIRHYPGSPWATQALERLRMLEKR